MPTYTYACTECGHRFDVFHGISDNSTRYCPGCEAEAHRQIGAGAGLVFKGSGFYITDYKNGKTSPANGSNGHGHHHNGSDHGHAAEKKNGTNGTAESSKPASDTAKSEGKKTSKSESA
ncbi:hypothetical protein GF324_03625 [bacterium]|nr:hypothetical protein [bacterium]